MCWKDCFRKPKTYKIAFGIIRILCMNEKNHPWDSAYLIIPLSKGICCWTAGRILSRGEYLEGLIVRLGGDPLRGGLPCLLGGLKGLLEVEGLKDLRGGLILSAAVAYRSRGPGLRRRPGEKKRLVWTSVMNRQKQGKLKWRTPMGTAKIWIHAILQ